ncbi:MAG TPA: DNRLRE domain-containing protein [Saprospiraceae bacterium]|nr:DNRLRE domain-containing protein [Saprospiraceae bacterium]
MAIINRPKKNRYLYTSFLPLSLLLLLPLFSSAADPIAIVKTGVLNDGNNNDCGDVGETITYTFTVTNTGETPLTEVNISDPLLEAPNPVVPIIFTGGDANGDQSLDPNETWTFTADYVLTQADIDAELVENQALAIANNCRETSELWGENGELWDPQNSELRDFSDVGYMSGDVSIPDWPVGVDVTNFGAIPNDGIDDSQAFIDAIAACPDNQAVFVPKGTFRIKQKIEITRANVVLRGEDMYETILYFPLYLTEIYPGPGNPTASGAFIDASNTSQIGVESLSFEFREQMKGNHWEFRGADAIRYEQVQDSWVRNVYIKNADHCITLTGNNTSRVSVLNIKLDQYVGRPDIYSGSQALVPFGVVGHVGIGIADVNHVLIHDVEFTGWWWHYIDILGNPTNSVISRMKGHYFSYNRHSQGGRYNLYTEAHSGVGNTITGALNPSDETYWNVDADVNIPSRYTDPNLSTGNIFVGAQTGKPDRKMNDFWIENLDQDCIYPQNMYLAQLDYFNKPLPEAGPAPIPSPYDQNVVQILATDDHEAPSSSSNPTSRTINLSEVYLKFDLTPLELSGVARARLKIRTEKVLNTPITIAAYSLEDDSWTQETLTLSNQPTDGPELASLDITEESRDQWYEFDVTDFVRDQWQGDQTVSIHLLKTAGSGTNSNMYTRDFGSGPRLIIEQSQVLPTPIAPTGLQTTSQEGYIGLDWDQHPDSANITYSIYRREEGNPYSGYPIATGLTESQFNDVDYFEENKESSDVPADRTFYYVVVAVNKAFVESAPSAEQTGSSLDATPPTPPQRLAAKPGNQRIELSWRDARTVDFASYSVFRTETPGSYDFSMPLASGLTDNSYVDTDVTNGITYYYVVTEIDQSGNESQPSAENSATPSANIVALYDFNGSSSTSNITHPYTTASDLSSGSGLSTQYETRAAGERGNPIPSLTWSRQNTNNGTILDNDYLSFTVTVDAGMLNFQRLHVDSRSANFYLFSSQTGFTDINDAITQESSSGEEFTRHIISLSSMAPASSPTSIEFRLYFASTVNFGQTYVDNIILYAETTGLPPVSPGAQVNAVTKPQDQLALPTRRRTLIREINTRATSSEKTDPEKYCQPVPASTPPEFISWMGSQPNRQRLSKTIKNPSTRPQTSGSPQLLAFQSASVSDLSGTAIDNDLPTIIQLCSATSGSSVHVGNITLQLIPQGPNLYQGQATVLVLDENGNPVANANVTASFSGSLNETQSLTTNANGEVVFESTASKNGRCFDFSFCVSDISHASFSYDSNLNEVTCRGMGMAAENSLSIDAYVYLEGATLLSSGSAQDHAVPMHTSLNDARILPGQYFETPATYSTPDQPYQAAPWNYCGKEGSLYDSGGNLATADAGYPTTVVDWVLLSLRAEVNDAISPTCQTAALLHEDGRIEVVGGFNYCEVDPTQSYYLVVEHRNHLIVMSPQPLSIVDGVISYDFRSNQSYLNDPYGGGSYVGQKEFSPGLFGMYAGNGDQMAQSSSDTDINASDFLHWLNTGSLIRTYHVSDLNMDGEVSTFDREVLFNNVPKVTSVPRE